MKVCKTYRNIKNLRTYHYNWLNLDSLKCQIKSYVEEEEKCE